MREGRKQIAPPRLRRRRSSLAAWRPRRARRPDANPACGVPAVARRWLDHRLLESVGLDGARLCGIAARLKETEANIHAVVMARHGELVFEQYFAGL